MSLTTDTAPLGHDERRAQRPSRVARANAWFFDTFDEAIDARLRGLKSTLLSDIPSAVVEIGAGTGANLRYYPAGTAVVAVEPSAAMHPSLLRRAERHGIDLRIAPGDAARLPFEDGSVEMVVSTLVLCSVADPAAAVAEVHRVLRPGGRFVFVEHVRAGRRGLLRAVQRAVRQPWAFAFDGCDTCRDTEATVRALDWRATSIGRERPFDALFFPVSERIHGSVTR